MPRNRKLWSVKNELITKSREAMLAAVQIFNNPNILFKSETFCVLSIISWTYLLHAYFRNSNIEYRHHSIVGVRKKFDKTARGAYKYWELERCLNDEQNPVDNISKENLKFIVGLRHEIEHQMTTRIDDFLSARFQACCLNYNEYIKRFFGDEYGIDKHLSFSLQFSTIAEDHASQLRDFSNLPPNIAAYINDFDASLNDSIFNDMHFSYRVLYVPKSVNHRGQADRVIEFISADSPEAVGLNRELVLIKDREKNKLLPSDIVNKMKELGYVKFSMYDHTIFWKEMDAKNPSKGYGVNVARTWYWYENWMLKVKEYCERNSGKFRANLI